MKAAPWTTDSSAKSVWIAASDDDDSRGNTHSRQNVIAAKFCIFLCMISIVKLIFGMHPPPQGNFLMIVSW